MVRVLRDTEEASAFRVVVAVGAESMAQPRGAAKNRYPSTVHPKAHCRKWVRARKALNKYLRSNGLGWKEGPGGGEGDIPLDNSRHNEYYCYRKTWRRP